MTTRHPGPAAKDYAWGPVRRRIRASVETECLENLTASLTSFNIKKAASCSSRNQPL